METSFEATEKKTIDAEEGTEVHEVPARSLSEPLECLCMGKQMRWLVGLIETEKSTEYHGNVTNFEIGKNAMRFTFLHINQGFNAYV